jgi:HEPN domain-containing protein
MSGDNTPRIRSTFFQADAFHLAAHRLTQSGVPDISLMIAQVVNSSFSSELYLKCLILIETGNFPHEHHLAKLFDELPDKTKQVIENEWNAETAKRSTVLDEIDRRAGGAVTARTLTDALSKEGDAFVDWRYAHEPGPLCNFSLSNLPAILRKQILAIRPELLSPSPPVQE